MMDLRVTCIYTYIKGEPNIIKLHKIYKGNKFQNNFHQNILLIHYRFIIVTLWLDYGYIIDSLWIYY